ncbi:MAG TPA: MFS transporter [Candidatus Binataceae bacterium]|nr:MFS transporter [Candidatus Binataceae bacterium]
MTSENQASPYRWVIEGLLISGLLVQEAVWLAPAPILEPIIKSFNIGLGRAGMLISIIALFIGVFAILGGLMGSRMGIIRWIVLGAWMMGIGAVLSGFTTNYWTLFACRALEGIGFGIIMGPAQALPMQWFPPREWPYINSVNLVCGNISLAVTFAVTPSLYYLLGSSWGRTLTFYGVLEIGVAILWTIFGRENKSAPAAVSAAPSPAQPTHRLDVLKRSDVLLATLGIFGGVWMTSLHGAFMPQFFHTQRALTLSQAGRLAAIPTIAAIAGSFLGGVASGLVGRRRPFTWPLAIVGICCTMGTLLIPNYGGIFTAQLLGGLFGSMVWPVVVTMTMELPGMTPELAHIALAFAWGTAFIGGFFAPLVAGAAAQVIGLQASMIIFTLVGLSQLGFYFIPETGKGRAVLQVAVAAADG